MQIPFENCTELRLPTFRKNYESAAVDAASANLSFEQYLHGMLKREYAHQPDLSTEN